MTLNTTIPSLSFASNFLDLIITSSEEINFVLEEYLDSNWVEILNEDYAPNSENQISIELREFLEQRLTISIPDSELNTYHQKEGYRNIRYTLTDTGGTIQNDVFVIMGGIDSNRLTDELFIKNRMLTWQPRLKYVKEMDTEWLTIYSDQGAEVKATAINASGTKETATIYSLESGLYSFNCNWEKLKESFAIDPIKIELTIDEFGTLRNHVQSYILYSEHFDDDDLFVFRNSIAGIDTIRFTGLKQEVENFAPSSAIKDRSEFQFEITPTRQYVKNTGIFRSESELLWASDFFASTLKYVNIHGLLYPIILDSRDLPSQQLELNNYTFRYRESEQSLKQNYLRYFGINYKLSAPTNISFSNILSSSLKAALTSNSDALEYGFEWQISLVSSFITVEQSKIGDLGVKAISFAGLEPEQLYYVRAREGGLDPGPWSKTYTVSTQKLDTPSGLILIAYPQYIGINFLSNSDSLEEGFHLEVSLDNVNFYTRKTLGKNITFYEDSEIIGNTPFYYRVRAFKGSKISEYSPVDFVVTLTSEFNLIDSNGDQLVDSNGDLIVMGSRILNLINDDAGQLINDNGDYLTLNTN